MVSGGPAPTLDAPGEGSHDGAELGAVLAAIVDDVQCHVAAACDAVTADFAAQAEHARKHLSPSLRAAVLAALHVRRKAALAAVKRNAAVELAARKKAALSLWRHVANPARNQPKPKPS